MIVSAENLDLQFIVREARPGLGGMIRGLFRGRTRKVVTAVSKVAFGIAAGEMVGLPLAAAVTIIAAIAIFRLGLRYYEGTGS